MEISYLELRDKVIGLLAKSKVGVLSTSYNDKVTSRAVSIVSDGLNIYFQSNKVYEKHKQMEKNKNVALCINNLSIEGVVEEIGTWKDEINRDLLGVYKSIHESSFNYYGMLEGQCVYKIKPIKIKLWEYIDGTPIRKNLYTTEEVAEKLEFM